MKDYELVYKFEKGIMTDKERQQFMDDYRESKVYANYLKHTEVVQCQKEL